VYITDNVFFLSSPVSQLSASYAECGILHATICVGSRGRPRQCLRPGTGVDPT
jgi:hypothetical protein